MKQVNRDDWMAAQSRQRGHEAPGLGNAGLLVLVAAVVLVVAAAGWLWLEKDKQEKLAVVRQQIATERDRAIRIEAAVIRARKARAEREAEAARRNQQGSAAPASQQPADSDIHAVCVYLKMMGATTCDLQGGLFSSPYFDATLPASPAQASLVCRRTGELTRKPGSPFIGGNWQLKLFSPASETRPTAVCNL